METNQHIKKSCHHFFSVNKGTLIHLEHDGNNAISSLYTEQRCVKEEEEEKDKYYRMISPTVNNLYGFYYKQHCTSYSPLQDGPYALLLDLMPVSFWLVYGSNLSCYALSQEGKMFSLYLVCLMFCVSGYWKWFSAM